MLGTLIRISDDELKLLNTESIPFEGGGYAAGLGVAHNLHCIVSQRLRDCFPNVKFSLILK